VAASLEKVRFLIVDDNVHMVNIVKTLLRGFGATHALEAKDAQEAFLRLKNDPVDIIVLDFLMGDEDGLEFLKKLRNEEESPAPYVPVIMLTAHSDRARVEAARDAGATEFCAKPVAAAELLRKITTVVDHPRAFVRAPRYFGPDRRRRASEGFRGEDRRRDRDTPSDTPADG